VATKTDAEIMEDAAKKEKEAADARLYQGSDQMTTEEYEAIGKDPDAEVSTLPANPLGQAQPDDEAKAEAKSARESRKASRQSAQTERKADRAESKAERQESRS
jgi:hypothetical protein